MTLLQVVFCCLKLLVQEKKIPKCENIVAPKALDQLHEEQEHTTKVDVMQKALEEQAKQLQVHIQESEAAALSGAKLVNELEARVSFVIK